MKNHLREGNSGDGFFVEEIMRKLEFFVPENYNGVTVKGFLRSYCQISARMLAKLKRVPKGITADGKLIIATDHLKTGQKVILQLPEDEPYLLLPKDVPAPKVLWEDPDFLAVDKRAGQILYRRPGHEERNTLMASVCTYLGKNGEPAAFRPLYRLDKDTTGIILLAKNSYAASAAIGKIHKVYYAVCEGILSGCGTVNAPIGLVPGHSLQRMVREDGAPAITHWKVIGSGKNQTLLACSIETGRTHQIRVHMAYLGHPLCGDDFYGGRKDLIFRQALHCGYLKFIHPITKSVIKISAPFPKDFCTLLSVCNINCTKAVCEMDPETLF